MPQANIDPLARRRPPTQRRAEVLVTSVRQAARQILENEGPSALTTNRVAEVAGVSVGSLYHYYPNKDSIVADLFDELVDRLADEIVESGEQVHLDEMPLDRALELLVSMMLRHRQRLTGLHREFLETWGSRFEVTRRIAPDGRTFGQVTHDSLVELFAAHRAAIGVEDLDAAAYGVSLLAEGFGRACWEERLPDVPMDQLRDDLVRSMLAYLRFDPDRAVARS